MAEISAKMVMGLREKTGAAMMLCKEALIATDANEEDAIVYIRTKLGKKFAGATERSASDGVIAIAAVGNTAAIIELNSETDFVARNDEFRALANELAIHVATTKPASVEIALTQASLTQPEFTVQQRIEDVFSRLRERIVLNRFGIIETQTNGVLGSYIHVPSADKTGVIVELAAGALEATSDELKTLARNLAIQVAGAKPKYLNRDEVPEKVLQTEKDIVKAAAIEEGKPEAAIEKIVDGRVRKFYEETVLLDQPYQRDQKMTITQVLAAAGEDVSIKGYIRFVVGESAGA